MGVACVVKKTLTGYSPACAHPAGRHRQGVSQSARATTRGWSRQAGMVAM